MPKKVSFEEFERKARLKHGDKFIYSKTVYQGMTKSTEIECPYHGIFEQRASEHLKYGCYRCGREITAKKLASTTEEILEKFENVHKGFYTYKIKGEITNKDKINIVCPKHGGFEQNVAGHLVGHGCPVCRYETASVKRMKSVDEVIQRFLTVHGSKYDYSKVEYKGNHTNVDIVCPLHGVFSQSPANHSRGKGCPKCKRYSLAVSNTKDLFEVIKDFDKVHKGTYDYSKTEYRSSKSSITIICRLHGEFEVLARDHLGGKGCPECSSINRSLNQIRCCNDVIKDFIKVHGDKYDYSEVEYYGAKYPVKIICKVHGEFIQTAGNHLAGKGCTVCGYGESKAERDIADHCRSLGLTVIPRTRDIIPPLELDIYLPEKNIAIEYNGLYWHSEQFKPADSKRSNQAREHMVNKQEMCGEHGIRLIHINSDDPFEVVKRTLNMILQVDENSLHADQCECVMLDDARGKELAKDFLDENHLQGGLPGLWHTFGLTYQGELVAVMTFVFKDRIKKTFDVRRYCSSLLVEDAVSRLVGAFYNRFPYCPKLTAYSDNRWFTGKVYEEAGFVNDGQIPPDYKYVKGGTILPKNHFTRARMAKLKDFNFDPALSERENCINNGFYRVWDCGKTRWVREIL